MDSKDQENKIEDQVDQNQEQSSDQVFSYQAPWVIYALGFSTNPEYNYRIAIASFLEDIDNQIEIVQLNQEKGEFEKKCSFEHKYPPTKLIWIPDKKGSHPDILATSGEYLKIWQVQNNDSVILKCDLINQNEFSAPLTSFDWNLESLNLIGTASIDTTCTIWDIEKQTVFTQLIAHDKEVYDISFSSDKNLFASVGADGSARQFDLRNLEHSTVLYETENNNPLLKLAWNRNDPHYIAVIEMDQNYVTLLDTRNPLQPICKFNNHKDCVNGLAWAPQSSSHICTVGDDHQSLIWDLTEMRPDMTEPLLEYRADGEIANLSWSLLQNEWLAICQNRPQTKLYNHQNLFYTGKIKVGKIKDGKEDLEYNMIFDTGSTAIFLNSILCSDIGCQKGNQYNSENSFTYKNVDLEIYTYFGSGELGGKMAIDTIRIGDTKIEKVEFFQINKEVGQAFEQGEFDGIIGLSYPALGGGLLTIVDYMKQQGIISEKVFNFYLNREDESDESFLSFGKVDKKLVDGEINYHKVSNPMYWTIQAENFLLDGNDIGLCSDDHKCNLVIDSGTSIVTGPEEDLLILFQYLSDSGYDCNDIKKMPTITFVIDGQSYHIHPEEYIISFNGIQQSLYKHADNPTECTGGFIPMNIKDPILGNLWIIGDLIMSKFLTVFDRENNRIGFGKLKNLNKQIYEENNGHNAH
ncbi:WD repeat protein [Ichthyophthirius multifiliis]|uniref:WD repeat protein n=1 Tax=Ichthyophthirius multifiliis TaxID=5932 RepID=G0QVU1_ICHMU|nr:WD repeat protein [Ichthyophthirius multifiliis]EGR30663.1 WD repeat protein [Ichthyophthirius multifiliis]|eukprot:XP_004032250.1 WD repeat protein [Ichthyophthirius multifiliis]